MGTVMVLDFLPALLHQHVNLMENQGSCMPDFASMEPKKSEKSTPCTPPDQLQIVVSDKGNRKALNRINSHQI
jgi:hypothetical protein